VFAGADDEACARLRAAVRSLAIVTRGRTPTGMSHGDSDDVVGTVASDDAIGFDPFPLLAALHEAGAQAVVIGQVAGILHGSSELTGDLDLLWDGDQGTQCSSSVSSTQGLATLLLSLD
jgi:hypothetical protein